MLVLPALEVYDGMMHCVGRHDDNEDAYVTDEDEDDEDEIEQAGNNDAPEAVAETLDASDDDSDDEKKLE